MNNCVKENKLYKHFRLPLLKLNFQSKTSRSMQRQKKMKKNSFQNNIHRSAAIIKSEQKFRDKQLIRKLKIISLIKSDNQSLLQMKFSQSLKAYRPRVRFDSPLFSKNKKKSQFSLVKAAELKKKKSNSNNDEQGLYVSKKCVSSRQLTNISTVSKQLKVKKQSFSKSFFKIKNINENEIEIKQISKDLNKSFQPASFLTEIKKTMTENEEVQQQYQDIKFFPKHKINLKMNKKKLINYEQEDNLNRTIKGWTRYFSKQNDDQLYE